MEITQTQALPVAHPIKRSAQKVSKVLLMVLYRLGEGLLKLIGAIIYTIALAATVLLVATQQCASCIEEQTTSQEAAE